MNKLKAWTAAAAFAATLLAVTDASSAPKIPNASPIALLSRTSTWDCSGISPPLGDLKLFQIGSKITGDFEKDGTSAGSLDGYVDGRVLYGKLTLPGIVPLLDFAVALEKTDYDSFNGNYRLFGKVKTLTGTYRRDLAIDAGASTVLVKVAAPPAFKNGIRKLSTRIALAAAVQDKTGDMLPSRMAKLSIRIPYAVVDDAGTRIVTTSFTTIHPKRRIVDLSLVQNLVTVDGQQYWRIDEPLGALGLKGDKAICLVGVVIDEHYPFDTFDVFCTVESAHGQFEVVLDPASTTHLSIPIVRQAAAAASSD